MIWFLEGGQKATTVHAVREGGSVRTEERRQASFPLRVARMTAYAIMGLAVASCTVLSSTSPDRLAADGHAPTGTFYALPMGLVPVTLKVKKATGRYYVDVGVPEYSPDPKHRYLLQYRPMPNYDDVIHVEVTPGTGLIKKINSTTTDQTPAIIANLTKLFSGGGFEVSPGPAGTEHVAGLKVDVSRETELAQAAARLNAIMRAHAGRNVVRCRADRDAGCNALYSAPPCTEGAQACAAKLAACLAEPPKGPGCAAYAQVEAGSRQVRLRVEVPSSIPAGVPSDCTVGICYRPKEPYVIAFGVGGLEHVTIVELPNRAMPIELDFQRAFLVKKIQNIEFDDSGFLQEAYIEKESELVALAKLPLDIVGAVGDALALRVKVVTRQANVARKKAALLKAEADLQKAKAGGDGEIE
jgi:hypothetical protein